MTRLNPSSLRFISVGLGLWLSLLANHAGAIVYFWDPQTNNTQVPYLGDMSGTWGTSNWSTNSAGQATPQAWQEGVAACFGANTGFGTPPFTVTLSDNHSIAGVFNGDLAPNACNVTINGPGIMIVPGSPQGFAVHNSSDGALAYTTINVVIAGSGATPTFQGDGQLFFNATNTFSGGTLVGYKNIPFTGTLNFNNTGSFGTGSITLSNTSPTFATLAAEGNLPITITNGISVVQPSAGLNLIGNPAGVTFSGPWSLGANTLNLGSGGNGNLVIISGVISGSGVLNKFNPGTLEFTATNTFSGSTTITGGALLVNGSLAIAPITVGTNATLGGYGTINGPVTVQSGGTLALGASIGTLTINSTLNLAGTTIMKVSHATTLTNDVIRGIARVTFGGALNVTAAGPLQPGDTFQLFKAVTYIGSFAATNLPAGATWDTSRLSIDGSIHIRSVTPTITWTNPAAITYGTALSSAQLNATASVPGAFAYNPTNGAVLNAGTSTLTAVFTPTDTTNYNSATSSVSLVVLRAPLSVTASNATRPYGQSNPAFGGTIAGLQNGDNITATYAAPAATPTSPPGSYAIVPSLVDPSSRIPNYSVMITYGLLTVTCAPITLSPLTLPGGAAGLTYTQNLSGAGGAAPYTFAITAGSLPAGLNLSSSGTLSGTPVPVGTNTFSVTATDTNGCAGSQAYVLVLLGAHPNITGQPQDSTNNAGTTATFIVSADGTAPLGYRWFQTAKNDRAGATNATLSLTNVQSSDVAGYSVLVTNAYGSATSSVARLTVLFPPVIVQQPQNRAAGIGGTAQFSVSATSNTSRTYQWQLSETNLAGRVSSSLVLTSIKLSDFGGYRVIVSNSDGSTTSQVAFLTVALQPQLAPPEFNLDTLYLDIPTEIGPVYVVEYKTALQDPLWHELTSLNGTGGILPVTDDNPTNSARFYRIRMR